MAAELTRSGRGIWPGVIGPVQATYTTSHGISPGCIVLVMNPQPGDAIADEGDFLFDDGVVKVLLRDCKMSALKRTGDTQQGFVDTLEILDHRWKWTLGAIDGCYNQLDANKKLIGFTIRSPYELAVLCLQAMGETNYSIDLPFGLPSSVGARAFTINPPWMGVIPITGTNPPTNWDAMVPAVALAQLAELYGRRVIWNWRTGRVLIAVPGFGASLPPGSTSSETPKFKSALTPNGVGVLGAPTRWQPKLLTEPVGEDWWGGIVPIDQLSYAPMQPGRTQISEVIGSYPVVGGSNYNVGLAPAGQDPFEGDLAVVFTLNALDGDTLDIIAANITGQINDDARWKNVVMAFVEDGITTPGRYITIRGLQEGFAFACGARISAGGGPNPDGAVWSATLVQAAARRVRGWAYSRPPTGFINDVTPVPGILTRVEAARLAQKTVWKLFRIKANADGSLPINIPGYGLLNRRQQIMLESTQVEQVTPATDFQIVLNPNLQAQALNFYNGYSHDKPLAVFGSVARLGNDQLLWPGALPDPNFPENTDPSKQLLWDFTVDPVEQTISCTGRYCFRTEAGLYLDPRLILQTGCTIRNAASNAEERCIITVRFPQLADIAPIFTQLNRFPNGTEFISGLRTPQSSPTNYAYRTFPDVQASVIGRYSDKTNTLISWRTLEADPIIRGSYYLAGLAAQYYPGFGQTNKYNGFMDIDLDGAIQQVTWNCDTRGGCDTMASRNAEHHPYIIPYPGRRRAEFLPPARQDQIDQATSPPNLGPGLFGGAPHP